MTVGGSSSGLIRSSGMHRAVAFALALVFQLLLPPALTVADGWMANAERAGVGAVHVEDLGHKGCPRVHQEDKCVICQFAAQNLATPTAPTRWSGQVNGQQTGIVISRLQHVAGRFTSQALARAPPVV